MAGKEVAISLERPQIRNSQILVFVGPEGSGKSTQAEFFAKDCSMPYISVSDLIREKARTDITEIGEECRAVFAQKRYIDPNVLTKIYENRFRKKDTENGFVLDGAMRTQGEIKNFDTVLQKANRAMLPVIIIYLKTPGWESTRRLLNRKRTDDTLEGIVRRLTHYHNHLAEKAVMMKKKWNFLQVNVGQYGSKESVHEEIKTRIDALKIDGI